MVTVDNGAVPTGGSGEKYGFNFQDASLRVLFDSASDVRQLKLAKLSTDSSNNATKVRLIPDETADSSKWIEVTLTDTFQTFTLSNDFLAINSLDLVPITGSTVGIGQFAIDDIQSVPEPRMWIALLVGSVALIVFRRFRRPVAEA